jgi:acetolactate synthase I/II/III large subunit
MLPSGKMSSNIAVHLLSDALQHTHHIVVDGGGTALYAGFQSAVRGQGKRLICSTGISSMGTGLAETLGVSLSLGRVPVLTIIGDGSFIMNIQDLASLAQHRLPVAIAVINNDGYLAIKHTQRDYLGGRYYGTNSDHGLMIPPFRKIVEGFGLRYREITTYDELTAAAAEQAHDPSPLVLDLKVDSEQDTLFRPAVSFNANGTSTPHDLSEMWPFQPPAMKGP